MVNPEILETLGTQKTIRRQTRQHRKLKRGTKNSGVNPGALEGLAVPTSYETFPVKLVYTSRVGHPYAQTQHK